MAQSSPNILLITSDQHHWSCLGCLHPLLKTPNLDRLAREGTMFTRAYTVNPTCTPTRASIITGKYPSQHGAYSLGTKLPESEHTVGEDFQAAGYRTALVGKAHFQQLHGTDEFPSLESYPIMQDLDYWRKFHGPFYGFEHVELARNHGDEPHAGQHYAIWMEENGLPNWRDYFRKPTGHVEHQRYKWALPERYHTDAWIADRTHALLKQYARDAEPFFLWSSFFDPHFPQLVPEPWDTMYDPADVNLPSVVEGEHDANPPYFQLTQEPKPDFSPWRVSGHWCHGFRSHVIDRESLAKNHAVYLGMVSMMDKYIGRILDKLDESGLAENTLVIFTTDHGEVFGQHGLNGKGAFHYDDLLRLPFIARWPGKVPAGARSDALLSLVDLPTTFLSLAGIDIPRTMVGVDQTRVLCGKEANLRDHVIVEDRHEPDTIHVKTYIDRRYKITVYYNHEYGGLFDLEEDPNEVSNLWWKPECAELKAELLLKLIHAEMGKEPLWMPRTASA